MDKPMNDSKLKWTIFGDRLVRSLIYLALIIGTVISVMPFFWMLSTSIMTTSEALSTSKLVTSQPLLVSYQYSAQELDTLLSVHVPDFIDSKVTLGTRSLKMTAREYAEESESYWVIGNKVYSGGLVNYLHAWRKGNFSEYLLNSVQITLITLSGELLISILAAYAFARMRFPGRNLIFGILISSMMIPGMVIMIPNFITIAWLERTTGVPLAYAVWGILTLAAVVLAYLALSGIWRYIKDQDRTRQETLVFLGFLALLVAAIRFGLWAYPHLLVEEMEPISWFNNWPALTIPFMGSIFSIFLLRQFFSQVPADLFDAAQIDGAGHWQFLWKVALPLSKAPIMVITVLSFIGSWNALAWPLLVTKTPDWRPIAVGLYTFVDQEAGSMLNLQMAGAVVTIIPILILYFLTQRQFTESISRTGLKG